MARMPVAMRFDDVLAIERAAGRLIQTIGCGRPDAGAAVDGASETIEDAADQIGTDGHLGVLPARDDAVVQLNAVDLFERHGEHVAVAKADHLSADAARRWRSCTSQKSPTATAGPRDATSMPTSSTTSPVHGSSSKLRTPAM